MGTGVAQCGLVRSASAERCGFDSHSPAYMRILDDAAIQLLYQQLSLNVRALSAARDSLLRDINQQIKRGDAAQVAVRTKLLALLYSAWSEAQFLQIAYTPHAFMPSEIAKIRKEKADLGIERAWEYMLTEAVRKVGSTANSKDLRDRLHTLIDLVAKYIGPPARIRNRVAHGQWIVALNSESTAENVELTKQISELDPVLIEKQFEVHQHMGAIVRDLVQSPKMGFHKHYWTNFSNLQDYLERTKDWTVDTKRNLLLAKRYIAHRC